MKKKFKISVVAQIGICFVSMFYLALGLLSLMLNNEPTPNWLIYVDLIAIMYLGFFAYIYGYNKLSRSRKKIKKVRKRLFVDMDGTLAEWRSSTKENDLYKKGYFFSLKPQPNVVTAIRALSKEYDVYILSCFLPDSPYALLEKEAWLKKYMPEINMEHQIFVPYGKNKSDYVPGGITEQDFLLDDYTINLLQWEGIGIKCLNGINHTRQTWKEHVISAEDTPQAIKRSLKEIMA